MGYMICPECVTPLAITVIPYRTIEDTTYGGCNCGRVWRWTVPWGLMIKIGELRVKRSVRGIYYLVGEDWPGGVSVVAWDLGLVSRNTIARHYALRNQWRGLSHRGDWIR